MSENYEKKEDKKKIYTMCEKDNHQLIRSIFIFMKVLYVQVVMMIKVSRKI